MKQVAFEEKAFEDFTNWATQDKKLYTKIIAPDFVAGSPKAF